MISEIKSITFYLLISKIKNIKMRNKIKLFVKFLKKPFPFVFFLMSLKFIVFNKINKWSWGWFYEICIQEFLIRLN